MSLNEELPTCILSATAGVLNSGPEIQPRTHQVRKLDAQEFSTNEDTDVLADKDACAHSNSCVNSCLGKCPPGQITLDTDSQSKVNR